MSIVSTKRHSSQNLNNIEFGKKVLPHLAKHERKVNLDKANAFIDKALKSRNETDMQLNAGNAIVCLKRVISS